jgi:pimeloyl-ACP methyl ester carboxylesterase
VERTRQMHRRAPVLRLLVAIAVAATTLALGPQEAQAADAIESSYQATGSWAVTYDDDGTFGDGGETCDPNVAPVADYTVVYPTALSFGDDKPVVIWGNGTGTGANQTCNYQFWLRHFASWGFVVIAPNTGQTGTGDEMRSAADLAYLLDALNSPTNPFHDNVDTSHIAAVGHSQGALGAINAVIDAPNSVFSSVLALGTPDRSDMAIYNDPACTVIFFCCQLLFGSECIPVPLPTRNEMSTLDAPIFFLRGSTDFLSDQTPVDWYPNPSPPVPYAAASLAGADHINLTNGLGYMTAWLWYTADYCPGAGHVPVDPEPAFRGASPEIRSQPTKWLSVTLENLADCV